MKRRFWPCERRKGLQREAGSERGPEEKTLGRVPTFDTDMEATRRSRRSLEELAATLGAPIWIQHDSALFAALAKPPQFIE